jgi:hypothetical protein
MRGAFPVSILAFVAMASVPSAWAQGPIGSEFRVNTYTTSGQADPFVAMGGPLGNFVVVWDSPGQDGSALGIFGQRFNDVGAPLGPEFRVNTYTTDFQFASSVAADSAGNFVVVWQSYTQDGAANGIFGQRYSSSGAPVGAEFLVNTYTTASQSGAAVASDAAGNFVAVWVSDTQDGSNSGVFGQRFASAGAPLGPEFRVNTFTTGNQFRAAVAADNAGNFLVTWDSALQDGSSTGVFAQRFSSSGVPLGPEFRVNTQTVGDQFTSSAAADSSGNFIVVWQDVDGSDLGVFGQRYASSGAPLGPEFPVNTFTFNIQSRPSVTADTAGNFVVAWQSYGQDGGSSAGVFGQRYASSGAPHGSEFRVNTFTTSYQNRPAAGASDSMGNFVVVWVSDLQDGSATGVFGQIYRPIVPVELMRFGVE